MIARWLRSIRSIHARSSPSGGERTRFSACRRSRRRVFRRRAPAVLAEDPAREPAAPRGRALRRSRGHRGARRLGRDRARRQKEIAFTPARVLLQDFTGVPAVVDLAAMRDGIVRLGGDPRKVNPLQPVELVIDHSVQVDHYSEAQRRRPQRRARVHAQQGAIHVPALGPGRIRQLPRRAARHRHRPPGQSRVPRARRSSRSRSTATCSRIPTRSSAPTRTRRWSTASAWSGWGVGGIEAEAAMLGQPISMLIPEVVGFRLVDRLPEGRDRDRPGADDHRAAPQARRRRQVRRVLRAGPRVPDDRRPRDARQHVARSTARPSRSARSTR